MARGKVPNASSRMPGDIKVWNITVYCRNGKTCHVLWYLKGGRQRVTMYLRPCLQKQTKDTEQTWQGVCPSSLWSFSCFSVNDISIHPVCQAHHQEFSLISLSFPTHMFIPTALPFWLPYVSGLTTLPRCLYHPHCVRQPPASHSNSLLNSLPIPSPHCS